MLEFRPCQYVDTEAALAAMLDEVKSAPLLALDTESNSFHAYYERVCLVQLSTAGADYVLDPFRVDLHPLGEVLANPNVETVLHAADYDVRGLKRDYGFRFARVFDTMVAAKVLGRREIGLAALAREEFGVTLEKAQQRSDWGRRPLSVDQLEYASRDTRYLLPLRANLKRELERIGRLEEARRLFARQAASEPRPKRFNAEAYRRIRGAEALEGEGLAILRALYLAREEMAREANRPPFKICGDDVLVALARVQPHDLEGLHAVKGLGDWTIRRMGDAILKAVDAAARDSAATAA